MISVVVVDFFLVLRGVFVTKNRVDINNYDERTTIVIYNVRRRYSQCGYFLQHRKISAFETYWKIHLYLFNVGIVDVFVVVNGVFVFVLRVRKNEQSRK